MLKIYDEPESPHDGAVFKIHDEPESPIDGVCLGYMMKRIRQMMGRGKDI